MDVETMQARRQPFHLTLHNDILALTSNDVIIAVTMPHQLLKAKGYIKRRSLMITCWRKVMVPLACPTRTHTAVTDMVEKASKKAENTERGAAFELNFNR